MPAELAEAPLLPKLGRRVWGYFNDLSARRTSNGFGLNPITFLDIMSWQYVTGIRLDQWERDTILRLDAAFLAATRKQSRGAGDK